MQKVIFDLLLKYTAWLRGYRTLIGLFISALTVLVAVLNLDFAMFVSSSAAFLGTLMVVIGLRPEPGDGKPPPLPDGENWIIP